MKNAKTKFFSAALVVAIFPCIVFAGGSSSLSKAKVISISGKTITATFDGGTYTINKSSKTKVTSRSGKKMSFSKISVGDKLNVKGKITYNDVKAKIIKDLSVIKKK